MSRVEALNQVEDWWLRFLRGGVECVADDFLDKLVVREKRSGLLRQTGLKAQLVSRWTVRVTMTCG
jgi:hypothetical protein